MKRAHEDPVALEFTVERYTGDRIKDAVEAACYQGV